MSAQGITSGADKHVAAPRGFVARILEMFGLTLARPLASAEDSEPAKKARRRGNTAPTIAPEPEMTVRGGQRKVVLDDNWCGVVRQDYSVAEGKPQSDGRVKLYD